MQTVTSVGELYRDTAVYSSSDMFSPPSERLPHVIRFELTKGCSWGRCTFCGGFDGIRFGVKKIGEFETHVDEVFARIGKQSRLARSLTRIFIGGGDALGADTCLLQDAIYYAYQQFYFTTGRIPKRVALYGRTQDFLQKGVRELRRLERFLSLVYWGVESGSSEVLSYVNKGCTEDDLIKAAEIIHRTLIETSVMVMPGLGGMKFYREHIERTALVLDMIQPKFVTFMGINPAPNSLYMKRMRVEQESGANRPLTDPELVEQMTEMIRCMPVFDTKLGCFGKEIDAVGYNPLHFNSVNIRYESDKLQLINQISERAASANQEFYRSGVINPAFSLQ
jgi:hypothetical protein